MDNKPTFDRALLLPIILSGFSIIGIIAVLVIGRSLNSPPPVSASPSATQFQYLYLGTEPAITTPLVEGSDVAPLPTEVPIETPLEPPVEVTESLASPTSSIGTPIILTSANTTSTSTSIVLRTNTPSPLLTSTSTATLSTAVGGNTYDDTDSRIQYVGNWTSQTGVSGAYLNTLHISNTNGNRIEFSFTSQEIHVFYQAGPSLGYMTITIDGLGVPEISQAQNATQVKEWASGVLQGGPTHNIVISHSRGGSINIDSLVVPVPTATPTTTPPTATRTFTPTQQ